MNACDIEAPVVNLRCVSISVFSGVDLMYVGFFSFFTQLLLFIAARDALGLQKNSFPIFAELQ